MKHPRAGSTSGDGGRNCSIFASRAISVALGTVFLLNAVALFIFPPIGHALHLTQNQFGVWSAIPGLRRHSERLNHNPAGNSATNALISSRTRR